MSVAAEKPSDFPILKTILPIHIQRFTKAPNSANRLQLKSAAGLRFDYIAIKDGGIDEMENRLDMESLLTKEKTDAMCERIAKGLEENKISGSANVIRYALKVSWLAGFEEGRKYALK